MSSEEVDKKLPDIAEFCELGEYLDLPIRTYSSGMLTRLCFAIATAIDPDILLLDEGIAAGDARFASRAETRMQALIERTRILVLASHSESLLKDDVQSRRAVGKGPCRCGRSDRRYFRRVSSPQRRSPRQGGLTIDPEGILAVPCQAATRNSQGR